MHDYQGSRHKKTICNQLIQTSFNYLVCMDSSAKAIKALEIAIHMSMPEDKIYVYHIKENTAYVEKIERDLERFKGV